MCDWVIYEYLWDCSSKDQGSETYKRGKLLNQSLTRYHRTLARSEPCTQPPASCFSELLHPAMSWVSSGQGGPHNGCEASLASTKAPTPVPIFFGGRGESEAQ